jgi:undecaprenyl-diphosphatase
MDTTTTAPRRPIVAERRRSGWRRFEPALPVLCAVVFALLAWQVARHGVVTSADLRVRDALAGAAQDGVGRAALPWARRICALGNSDVAGPLLGAGALLATVLRRSLRPLLVSALAAALLIATVVPVKLTLGRAGPDDPWARLDWYGYFPSGHTATALICYGTLVAVLFPVLGRLWRRVLTALVTLVGVLVGVSLLYARYHWASDVVASFALGALVLWSLFRLPRLVGLSGRS